MIGRVYIMRSGDLVYIGSTTLSLNRRMYHHKSDAKLGHNKSSRALFQTGLPVTIELLEEVEIEDKNDRKLREREQHYMDLHPERVNKQNAIFDAVAFWKNYKRPAYDRARYLARLSPEKRKLAEERKAKRDQIKLLKRAFKSMTLRTKLVRSQEDDRRPSYVT